MGPPTEFVEREVKLDAGLRFELPEFTGILPGVVATRLPNAKLQAIYVDTADLRLMRWGVTLRHRRDAQGGAGTESAWTVKLPSDSDGVALVRNELTWPGDFGPVPAEVSSMVRAFARQARLEPVAKLITERHRVDLRDREGHKMGEIDDDVVSVMDGRRLAARFRQVELEVTETATAELVAKLLEALTVAGAVAGDDRPKVVRAIGPRAALGPDVAVAPVDRTSTVSAVVAASIGAGVTRIITHDPGVRLGDDPEHVHQARVGTRRLRSDLRTFWSLLDPTWAGPIRGELGWLGATLGEVRDTDVLLGRLQSQIRSLPGVDAKPAAALLGRLAAQREEARLRLLAAMDTDRYVALLENLSQAAARPPLASASPVANGGRAAAAGSRGAVITAPLAGLTGSGGIATDAGTGQLEPAQPGAGGADPEPAPSRAPGDDRVAGDGSAVLGAQRSPAVGPTVRSPTRGGTGGLPPAATTQPPATPATPGAPEGCAPPSPGPAALDAATVPPPPPNGFSALPSPQLVAGTASAPMGPVAPTPASDDRRAADVLPPLVRRRWKHLRQAIKQLGDDPLDDALHEVRIRAKRMRYAAEVVADVVGKPARRLAAAIAEVQGELGDLHDAVVAEAWLRRQGTAGPHNRAVVAGELVMLERQLQATCRQTWGRRWKAASKKSLRKWLRP